MESAKPWSSVHSDYFRDLLDLELAGVMETCLEAALAATSVAGVTTDWRMTGGHLGQYSGDVVADRAALVILKREGYSIFSEESGHYRASERFMAVIDPIDGSTNASRGLPLWCSSIAVLDTQGVLCGMVYAPVTDHLFWAVRGMGAYRNSERLSVRPRPLNRSIVFLNGHSSEHLGWAQYRALGSAALELVLVAAGGADAFVDLSGSGLAPWDYLAGELICKEAGVHVERVSVSSDVGEADEFKFETVAPFPLTELQRMRIVAATSEQTLRVLSEKASMLDSPGESSPA